MEVDREQTLQPCQSSGVGVTSFVGVVADIFRSQDNDFSLLWEAHFKNLVEASQFCMSDLTFHH